MRLSAGSSRASAALPRGRASGEWWEDLDRLPAARHPSSAMRPVLFHFPGAFVPRLLLLPERGLLCAMALATWRIARARPRPEHFEPRDRDLRRGDPGSRLFWVWRPGTSQAAHPEGDGASGTEVSRSRRLHLGGLAGPATSSTRMPTGRVTDLCAQYLTLSHIFGKVGRLLQRLLLRQAHRRRVGHLLPDHRPRPPAHPAQIYEFAGLIVLFILLHAMRLRRLAPGTLIATWLVGYGTLRFGSSTCATTWSARPTWASFRYQWTSLMAVGRPAPRAHPSVEVRAHAPGRLVIIPPTTSGRYRGAHIAHSRCAHRARGRRRRRLPDGTGRSAGGVC